MFFFVYLGSKGIIYFKMLKQGKIVIKKCKLLTRLSIALREKRPSEVNRQKNTTQHNTARICNIQDLAPSDYYLLLSK